MSHKSVRHKLPLASFKQQQGVALITALAIVVLVVAIAASIAEISKRGIRVAGSNVALIQAKEYAMGMEELALRVLAKDLAKEQAQSSGDAAGLKDTDSLADAWDDLNGRLIFDEASEEFGLLDMSFELLDAQGLFNINSLLSEDGKPDELAKKQLDDLIKVLEINQDGADNLKAENILAWISPQTAAGELRFEGIAEGELAFHAPKMPMSDLSELNMIFAKALEEKKPEVRAALLSRFRQCLIALPVGVQTNVNTAPAPVVDAVTKLDKQASTDHVKKLQGAKNPAESAVVHKNKLKEFSRANSNDEEENPKLGLVARSDFFRLRVWAKFLDREVFMTSIIERQAPKQEEEGNPVSSQEEQVVAGKVKKPLKVIYRDWSQRFVIPDRKEFEARGNKNAVVSYLECDYPPASSQAGFAS